VLWVREDLRGKGLARRLLDAAEIEAHERGCTQMVTSSHSFQAPEMYRARGYVEYGRIDDYPRGFAHIHFVKDLLGDSSAWFAPRVGELESVQQIPGRGSASSPDRS
jgi:GNAT superfamily N-acetyltransferase